MKKIPTAAVAVVATGPTHSKFILKRCSEEATLRYQANGPWPDRWTVSHVLSPYSMCVGIDFFESVSFVLGEELGLFGLTAVAVRLAWAFH